MSNIVLGSQLIRYAISPFRVNLLAFTEKAFPPTILVLAFGAKYEVKLDLSSEILIVGVLKTSSELMFTVSELSLRISSTDWRSSVPHSATTTLVKTLLVR